jgi:NAD(P)-dependent dehydrogenase (short-subunit alcohol dehydrogenase family)
MGLLQDKVILITGAGSEAGFGSAIARAFVAEGARVVLADINAQGARDVALSIGGGGGAGAVKPFTMNVTREEDWSRAVEFAKQQFGGLDVVVNNAGYSYRNKPTLDVTEADFDRVFEVNVKSVFWSAKYCIPQMQSQGRGGSIINISSVGSLRPRAGLVWYSSSKGAVSTVRRA